jgi:hypothetical protein
LLSAFGAAGFGSDFGASALGALGAGSLFGASAFGAFGAGSAFGSGRALAVFAGALAFGSEGRGALAVCAGSVDFGSGVFADLLVFGSDSGIPIDFEFFDSLAGRDAATGFVGSGFAVSVLVGSGFTDSCEAAVAGLVSWVEVSGFATGFVLCAVLVAGFLVSLVSRFASAARSAEELSLDGLAVLLAGAVRCAVVEAVGFGAVCSSVAGRDFEAEELAAGLAGSRFSAGVFSSRFARVSAAVFGAAVFGVAVKAARSTRPPAAFAATAWLKSPGFSVAAIAGRPLLLRA